MGEAAKPVNVYKVSSMVDYLLEGKDDVDILVQAINKARSDMEDPTKRQTPDCQYVAVIVGQKGTGARRYGKKKREVDVGALKPREVV